ncbi:MAG: hypothetical protein IJN93_07135 [Clostridia bacterium]|nr:hypothetical protein [Clostridia bacterium]
MANISFFDSIRYSDGIKEYRSNLSKYMLEPSVDNYSKLKNVQERSGLSIDICNTLISEEIQKPLDDILNKEKISKVELDYILKLTSTLNYSLLDRHKLEVRRKYSLWQIEDNNSLPVYKSGIVDLPLKKGEVVHFYENATLKKYKTKTTKLNFHGPVIRLRICKGFVYKLGSLNIDTKTSIHVENEDVGNFYITNKRVVFVGKKNNFSYYFPQIVKSELTDVGLVFQKENNANAKIVELSKYDLPLLILSRILND